MGSSADEDVPITRELCRSVAPTGFAVIAFALGFIGCVQCNVIIIKFTSTSRIDGFESDKPLTIQFGFWTHEDLQIYEYSDTNTNSNPLWREQFTRVKYKETLKGKDTIAQKRSFYLLFFHSFNTSLLSQRYHILKITFT